MADADADTDASPNHDFEGYVAHNYHWLQNTYWRHISPSSPSTYSGCLMQLLPSHKHHKH